MNVGRIYSWCALLCPSLINEGTTQHRQQEPMVRGGHFKAWKVSKAETSRFLMRGKYPLFELIKSANDSDFHSGTFHNIAA